MYRPLSKGSRRALHPVLILLLVTACGCTGETQSAAASGVDTGGVAAQETPRPGPGTAWVIFGADTVVAEVARTSAERQHGLMGRDEVPEGTGMLFVFEDESMRAFWMKDTPVPLDIAYLNSDLRIVTILQMEPLDTSTYPSTAPAMFALEVRQNWFSEQGIEEGAEAQVVFGRR